MARYDDGGIKFAEGQFNAARKYRDKLQKKQEKLFWVDTAAKGAHWLINQRADELDSKNVPALASYASFIEQQKSIMDDVSPYMETGVTEENYYKYLQNQYKTEAQNIENLDISAAQAFLNSEAKKEAALRFPSFKKMYEEWLETPNFKTFEGEALKYLKRENPRTIAGAVAKKWRNRRGAETPESIALKEKKATDALYGTEIFNQISELKEAVQEYNKKGNPIGDLVENLQTMLDKGELPYKVIGLEFKDSKRPTLYGEETVTVIRGIQITPSGPEAYYKEVEGSQTFKPQERKEYTKAQAEVAWNAALNYVSGLAKKDPLSLEYGNLKDKDIGLTIGMHILRASEDFERLGLSKEESLQRASQFILAQSAANRASGSTQPLTTTVTLFDAILQSPNVDLKKDILDRITDIRSDIRMKFGEDSVYEQETYKRIVGEIKKIPDSFASIDTKNEWITDLNKQFGFSEEISKVVPTETEDPDDLIVETGSKRDEKEFLKELNEVPYIGAVSEFMFGEELDLVDALWLIPGFGLLKIGGKVGTKLAVNKVISTVLAKPSTQKLITTTLNKISTKGPLMGFKTQAQYDKYVAGLAPLEQAIIKSMSKSGKSFNPSTFQNEFLKLKGAQIMAYVPSLGKMAKWGAAIGLPVGAAYYQRATEDKE